VPPQGRARWTLRLLKNKVVELGIVERASDSTIGRTLKKPSQTPSPAALGDPAEVEAACWVHARRLPHARAPSRSK
jgi:hypothetical protein